MEKKIKYLGSYTPSDYSGQRIVESKGIAPAVMENHGMPTATVKRWKRKLEK